MSTPDTPPPGQQPGEGQPYYPPYPQMPQMPQPPQQYPYGHQYPPQYPQQQYPPQYLPAPPTNGMAVASMVLGILWVYWIGSILALIFGYLARAEIKRTGQSGDGMAIAGIVLGWVGVGVLTAILVGSAIYYVSM